LGILAVAGGLLALVVVGLVLVSGGDEGVSARPLPSVVVLPDRPAAMDRAAVARAVSPVRRAVKAAPLRPSGCLDRAASEYAAQVADVLAARLTAPTRTSPVLPSAAATAAGCPGSVRAGFVVGPDASGVAQTRVSFGTADGNPAHRSGLLDPASRQVGYGVAVERVRGKVAGYVFACSPTSRR
jgi:hypothetical protein